MTHQNGSSKNKSNSKKKHKNESISDKHIRHQKYASEAHPSSLIMKVNVSSANCDQCFHGPVVTKPFLSLRTIVFDDYFILLHFR